MDDNIKSQDLIECISKKTGKHLIDISIIDLFKDNKITDNKKSITFRLKFNFGYNITSEQLNDQINEIVDELHLKFNTKLRM